MQVPRPRLNISLASVHSTWWLWWQELGIRPALTWYTSHARCTWTSSQIRAISAIIWPAMANKMGAFNRTDTPDRISIRRLFSTRWTCRRVSGPSANSDSSVRSMHCRCVCNQSRPSPASPSFNRARIVEGPKTKINPSDAKLAPLNTRRSRRDRNTLRAVNKTDR